MKTVTIDVPPLMDTLGDFTKTWKSGNVNNRGQTTEQPGTDHE